MPTELSWKTAGFMGNRKTRYSRNLPTTTLCKKYNKDDDAPRLYYYNRNVEVDFFVPEEALALQVSYSIQDEETRKREVNALVALNKLSPLKKACIITYDEEETIECDSLSIEVVPIWKWLLMGQQ